MADTVDHGSVVATVTVCARNAHVNLTVGTAARQSKMRVLWVTPLRMRDRLAGRALMGGSRVAVFGEMNGGAPVAGRITHQYHLIVAVIGSCVLRQGNLGLRI
jgi:hypothetical protein